MLNWISIKSVSLKIEIFERYGAIEQDKKHESFSSTNKSMFVCVYR